MPLPFLGPAGDFAARSGHRFIEPAHVFLTLLERAEGPISGRLAAQGITAERVRGAVLAHASAAESLAAGDHPRCTPATDLIVAAAVSRASVRGAAAPDEADVVSALVAKEVLAASPAFGELLEALGLTPAQLRRMAA